MTFGDRLRQARRSAGLSQTQLAGDRYSLSYVSHLEAGRRAPTPELVEYFEQRLGLPPGALHDAEASTVRQTPGGIVGLLLDADEAAREGDHAIARERALNAYEQSGLLGQKELRWMAMALAIRCEMELGLLAEATEHCCELLSQAERLHNASLTVRALLLSAQRARLSDETEQASDFLTKARAHAEGSDVSEHLMQQVNAEVERSTR